MEAPWHPLVLLPENGTAPPAGTCSVLALAVALRDRQSTVEGRFAAGRRWETAGQRPPGSNDRPLPARASVTSNGPGAIPGILRSSGWPVRLRSVPVPTAIRRSTTPMTMHGSWMPKTRPAAGALDGLSVGVRTVHPPDGFAGQQQSVLAASTTARGTKGNSQQTPGSLPRAGLGPGTSAHRRLPLRQPTRPRPAS